MCVCTTIKKMLTGKTRRGREECKCMTPCEEVVYVPSLSFASISTDEDAIKSRRQEAKMARLQERLTKAREITYRLSGDKYRVTLRNFKMVHIRANNLIYFTDAAEEQFFMETFKVRDEFNVVLEHCENSVGQLHAVESTLRSSVHPALQNLQNFLYMFR